MSKESKQEVDSIAVVRKNEANKRFKKGLESRGKQVFTAQVGKVTVTATPYRISLKSVAGEMFNFPSHYRFACLVKPKKFGTEDRVVPHQRGYGQSQDAVGSSVIPGLPEEERKVTLSVVGNGLAGGFFADFVDESLPTNDDVEELVVAVGKAIDVSRHEQREIQGGSGFGWG